MATNTQSKGSVVAFAQQLIVGTNKHLASGTQVPLQGGSFTPAQVTAKLQTLVNLRNDVDSAKAQTKAKLAVEKSDLPALRTFQAALVTYVKAAFGTSPDVLADFGLHPKTRTPMTVEAKTAAAAKRKATRAARHTTSPKQKKSIKGAVTGVTVTPITAPAPVAAAPISPSAATPTSPSAPAPSTGATAVTTPHS